MRYPTRYEPERIVARKKKDETRLHLTEPYLDVAAKRLVATDGHRLIAVPVDVDGFDVSGHVAGDLLKAARKKCRDEGEAEIRERRELVRHDIEWPCSDLGTFPNWQEVTKGVPAVGEAGTFTIALNAKLLKGLADALGTDGGVVLTMRTETPAEGGYRSPIRVGTFAGKSDEIALLMPLRLDGSGLIVDEEAEAKKKAKDEKEARRAELEAAGDRIIEHAEGRRAPSREVSAAVQALKDSVPEGTSMSVRVGDGPEHVVVDKRTPGKE